MRVLEHQLLEFRELCLLFQMDRIHGYKQAIAVSYTWNIMQRVLGACNSFQHQRNLSSINWKCEARRTLWPRCTVDVVAHVGRMTKPMLTVWAYFLCLICGDFEWTNVILCPITFIWFILLFLHITFIICRLHVAWNFLRFNDVQKRK